MHHEAIDTKIRVIFAGPYISRLIQGIRLREGVSGIKVEGSNTLITLNTLQSLRMVQVVGITYGTRNSIISAPVPSATSAYPPSPPATCPSSTPPTRSSTSHAILSMSFPLFQHWLGQSVVLMATNIGLLLSSSPSSVAPTLVHIGVNTADLVSKPSEASDSDGGDDSGREDGSE